ncbi:methionine--tRNA ligase [candidate division KSB1 bacterium]|nr:methionine--tRNA ligase [candidate division KSB1 bacterium]
MQKSYYITTPIYYVNADPHIGTSYTTVLADTLARYHRLLGETAFYLTGTDEHGEKIAKSAAAAGVSPQDWTDTVSARFKVLWPKLHIAYDRFVRTTEPAHVALVQKILQRVYDSGDIYFGEYGGHYCTGCERFLTEKELIEGKCPTHGTVPEYVQEQNYFFRMSKYQDWLIDKIQRDPQFIRPERYRNEALGYLREPLDDLCISRPRTRLSWGIEIPFDRNYVTYVWFDALLNYLTGVGYDGDPQWSRHWSAVEHIIGKDILKPHGIYWPTMLKAAGIEPFQHLSVHGYWTHKGEKISKSAGPMMPVEPLVRAFGADSIRYFLLRDMVFGIDAGYSLDSMVQRINSDLANDFGNLLSRISKLVVDHFDGLIPVGPAVPGALASHSARLVAQIPELLDQLKFHTLVEETMQLVRATNRYFEGSAPWALAKTDKIRCGEVLYECAEALRIAAVLLSPVMPERTSVVFARLGVPVERFTLAESARWGGLRSGAKLVHGEPLFPRIEERELPRLLPEFFPDVSPSAAAAVAPPQPTVDLIEIGDFSKVQLRVARVLSAERVEKADKLLKLQIEVGVERRQIIAGIAQFYSPESLIGRLIIVVANLKPARLRGEESQGMLLAAKQNGELRLLTVDGTIESGASVG